MTYPVRPANPQKNYFLKNDATRGKDSCLYYCWLSASAKIEGVPQTEGLISRVSRGNVVHLGVSNWQPKGTVSKSAQMTFSSQTRRCRINVLYLCEWAIAELNRNEACFSNSDYPSAYPSNPNKWVTRAIFAHSKYNVRVEGWVAFTSRRTRSMLTQKMLPELSCCGDEWKEKLLWASSTSPAPVSARSTSR